jgi:DNA-directed RNA polymerase specialized sigma24 family protein
MSANLASGELSMPANDTVQSAMAGDKQAFGELVSQYAGLVTGIAYSVCGDFARSQDIGQEAFGEA